MWTWAAARAECSSRRRSSCCSISTESCASENFFDFLKKGLAIPEKLSYNNRARHSRDCLRICRCDEIGRRSRLKICRRKRRTGSSPVTGTIYADLAHLVERHLAKVEVASSSLVTRSRKRCTADVQRSIRRHSQEVRQRSAKPLFTSSNLVGASKTEPRKTASECGFSGFFFLWDKYRLK